MAARKTTARKTAAKKKTTRKKAARKTPISRRIEAELPPNLRTYARQVRRQLTQLEREIDRGEARARRSATRLLREASHRLGHLEARGERAFKKLTAQARRDALKVLHRLEKAIEGPKPKRKPARKKAAARS